MDEIYTKEIDFAKYCRKCEHWTEPEDSDKCNDCLNEPVAFGTRKPIHFKEKTASGKRVKKKLA